MSAINNSTLVEQFLNHPNITIEGDSKFKDKLIKVINKTSELELGRISLIRMMDVLSLKNKKLIILSGNKNSGRDLDITLNFNTKEFVLALDDSGEVYQKMTRREMFIHEMTHSYHAWTNCDDYYDRLQSYADNELDNVEEEWTILGTMDGKGPVELCCDQAVCKEQKKPLRIDHSGWGLPITHDQHNILEKDYAPLRDFMRTHRHIKKLRALKKLIASYVNLGKNPATIIPLDLAVNIYVDRINKQDKTTGTGAIPAAARQECLMICLEIIKLLIKSGCKSDKSLETMALQYKRDFDAGSLKSDEQLILQKEYLEVIQLLMEAGCKSDIAISIVKL